MAYIILLSIFQILVYSVLFEKYVQNAVLLSRWHWQGITFQIISLVWQIYIFYGIQNQHVLLGTLKKTDTDETLLPQLFVSGIVK